MKIRQQVQTRYQVEDIVKEQAYGVEYQPIVNVHSGEIVAYEALARFYLPDGTNIPPEVAFGILHDDIELLCKAELDLKNLQIDYAPDDYDIFVNIDPHALCTISEIEAEPLVTLLVDKNHIVVELIENIDIHDARACTLLHSTLTNMGIRTALDDIGSPHAMTSLLLMTLVSYLKFDRMWLSKLDEDKHSNLLSSLLNFAKQSNKTTILEGVETNTMLETAHSFSIDYVQGFLYKTQFISVKP